jgi:thiamine-phosphate diphosphorylase
VLEAGVRTVQLRIKTPAAPDAAWRAMLRSELQQAIADSAAAGAELFVNDHWQLAHELGARGVHLGQEDLAALGDSGRAALRATGLALGISSHSLWELARARTLSPRYIACGPVWPTLTKDMPWLPQGLDNLAWWCRAAQVPVTAIGGILAPEQAQQAAGTGADGVCIVRGLGDDPRRTVPRFEAALRAGRARPIQAPAWPHPTLPH